MKIESANNQPISPEELKDLEKLRVLIERAIADGVLSKNEMETIKVFIRADGQITPQEVELCQQLIWDKITSGQLKYDWN